MEWKDWSNVLFSERDCLPSCSGIYAVADANNRVWYVGQAANLKNRWTGRGHHRYPQLIRSNRKLCHRIYWKQVQVNCLDEQERYYIDLFQPELNGCKVKKYLPKQPQVEREIKRLLKVVNNPTFLFPVIRSLVAGEYEDDNGIRCIVIIITVNDSQLIYSSTRKRYAAEVKKAWIKYYTYCGKDEQQYSQTFFLTYNVNGYRFEFVVLWELLEYLHKNSSAYESYVGVVELFGVQVKALKDLNILNELQIEEEYIYTNFEGKKQLKSAAYINYRKPMLKCFVNT